MKDFCSLPDESNHQKEPYAPRRSDAAQGFQTVESGNPAHPWDYRDRGYGGVAGRPNGEGFDHRTIKEDLDDEDA